MTKKLPLQGMKVLEWTLALTGPWSAKGFSDFGAEVIKIESTKFPDVTRITLPYKDNIPGPDRAPRFCLSNTGKKSFTLDLKKPRGIEIFRKLVAWSDIVLQNQRPGAMKKMGLGYEELKKIKEDIILIDISIMGQEGPLVGKVGGWGSNSMAQSGQFYYYRHPGSDPMVAGFTATTDAISPMFIAMTGIAAMDYKLKTGRGQHIDICQLEPIVHYLDPYMLDYILNRRIPEPTGNRNSFFAPHNVYRCKGNDKWCVIAMENDDEWIAFCHVLGNPEWTKSSKFVNSTERKKNEDELDELISQWTMNQSPWDVMTKLQKVGVPAGIVQCAEDIVDNDPQVKERGFLPKITHPVIGEFKHAEWGFKLSKTPSNLRTAPCLGEHNHYVCTKILGMSDDDFTDLLIEEVIN
jgi:benzylsuccinate CoA-transferase BbsF subunit